MFIILPCSCLCPIYWSQVLSPEWSCSWSSANMRCSNYIWVINNFIAHPGAPYIRGFHYMEMGLPNADFTRDYSRLQRSFWAWAQPIRDVITNVVSHSQSPYVKWSMGIKMSLETKLSLNEALARHWSLGSLLVTTATCVFGPYFIGTPHQRDNCVANNMYVLALLCVLRIANTCLSYMSIVYTWSSLNIKRTQARAWHLLGTWRCWLDGCQTFAWDIVKYAITSSFDWGQNPLFISKILYQVMAWRPFGARPLSDIICITKFSDKTCLVTEILSVTSKEGLKLLIQLLYIITNIMKNLWALVHLSFTQMKQYEHSAFWWTYDFYVNGIWRYLIVTSIQYTD